MNKKLQVLVMISLLLVCVVIGTAFSEESECQHREYTREKPAMCMVNAKTVYICTQCNNVRVVEHENTAFGEHLFSDNYQPDNRTSCTEDRTKSTACERCGAKHTIPIPGTAGHSYIEIAWDPATCAKGGMCYRQCELCGFKTQVAEDQRDHSFHDYISNGDTTCTKNCTATATCTMCTKTDTIEYPDTAFGHYFSEYVSDNNPTCTQDGTTTRTCGRCLAKETIQLPGTSLGGHSFSEYVSDNNATCVSDSTQTRTCAVCLAKETIPIPGTSLGGHSFSEYISDNNATCVSLGTQTATCTHAGCTQTLTKDGVGQLKEHDYRTSKIAATCTKKGYTQLKCKTCGKIENQDTVKSLGHRLSQWIFTGDGTHQASCLRDGCDYSENVLCTNAIVTLNGRQVQACTVCENQLVLSMKPQDINTIPASSKLVALDTKILFASMPETEKLSAQELLGEDIFNFFTVGVANDKEIEQFEGRVNITMPIQLPEGEFELIFIRVSKEQLAAMTMADLEQLLAEITAGNWTEISATYQAAVSTDELGTLTIELDGSGLVIIRRK